MPTRYASKGSLKRVGSKCPPYKIGVPFPSMATAWAVSARPMASGLCAFVSGVLATG
nr:hypothetical protein [uncultured Kingella sp.]